MDDENRSNIPGFIWLLAGSFIGAYIAFLFHLNESRGAGSWLVSIFATVQMAFASYMVYKFLKTNKQKYLFIALLLLLPSMIFPFALAYNQSGVINIEGVVVKDFLTSIYFSIVTRTTLGYGDFRPVESMRIVAACEAILGYVYMPVMLGVVISLLAEKRK